MPFWHRLFSKRKHRLWQEFHAWYESMQQAKAFTTIACARCGTPALSAQALFCAQCGNPLHVKQEPVTDRIQINNNERLMDAYRHGLQQRDPEHVQTQALRTVKLSPERPR